MLPKGSAWLFHYWRLVKKRTRNVSHVVAHKIRRRRRVFPLRCRAHRLQRRGRLGGLLGPMAPSPTFYTLREIERRLLQTAMQNQFEHVFSPIRGVAAAGRIHIRLTTSSSASNHERFTRGAVFFYGLEFQPRVFRPLRCPCIPEQCTWCASVRVTGAAAGEVWYVSGVFSE
jgi:hypothetical protein